MSAATTPKLDFRTREALDQIGRQLAQAYAITMLIADDQNLEDIGNHAAAAAATLIGNARQMLAKLDAPA